MIYYIIFLGLGINSLIINKKNKKLFIMYLIFFIFYEGLRWKTGTDWNSYYNYFKNVTVDLNPLNMEIGYQYLNLIIKKIYNNYSFFLIIYTLILYSLYLYGIYKMSKNFCLSVFIFYSNYLVYLGMNRQHLAMAICFVSIYFLNNNKKKFFFLLIGTAILLHKTSVIFLITYFILNKKLNIKAYSFLFTLTIVLQKYIYDIINFFFLLLKNIDLVIFYKINYYMNNLKIIEISEFHFFLGLIKRILVFLIFYYFIVIKNKKISIFLNLYFISIIIYIITFKNFIFLSRISIYFSIFEIILIPEIISSYSKIKKKGIILLIIFLFLFRLQKNLSVFPEEFIPYKNIIFLIKSNEDK